jgi:hypothetical protein
MVCPLIISNTGYKGLEVYKMKLKNYFLEFFRDRYQAYYSYSKYNNSKFTVEYLLSVPSYLI